jgi:hypothetical protein
MDSAGCIIANLVAGKLGNEIPSNLRLICSRDLDHINRSTVASIVNDGLIVLWPIRVLEVRDMHVAFQILYV